MQYPGVAAAVRADLQNLGMILRLAKRIAPGLDPKTVGEEIRHRIEEELDYELEAQNQRTLARHLSRAIRSSSCPTSSRRCHASACSSPSSSRASASRRSRATRRTERDRVGEILFRFYFGCMYRHHQFSGDPHPGNSMLLADGRVAFFDFGLFKRMPAGAVELEMEIARAVIEGDKDTIMRLGTEIGFFPEPDKFDPDRVLEHFRARPRGTRSTRRSSSPRVRDAGADRHERSALRVLRPAAPRVGAAGPHLRTAHGGADAGGDRAATRAATSTGSRASGTTTIRRRRRSASRSGVLRSAGRGRPARARLLAVSASADPDHQRVEAAEGG